MHITNRVGPPVEGNDFYGRQRELKIANRLLNAGNSLLLAAPRRIGKSSFAKKLLTQKKEEDWKCVYIDLEEVQTEEDFLKLLISSLDSGHLWSNVASTATKTLKAALNRIKGIKVGPVSVDITTADTDVDLYQVLSRAIDHGSKSLIVIDELTLFLNCVERQENGENKVKFILNWLRSLRQVSGTEVRWLFSGSVELNNFTKTHGLSYSINDLTEFHLGEMSRDEAIGLMAALSASVSFMISEDTVEYVINKLVWNIPYFIQLVVSQLTLTIEEDTITKDDIDKAYDTLTNSEYLSTWSERLSEYPNSLEARFLLKQLCVVPEGITVPTLIASMQSRHKERTYEKCEADTLSLLDMLENDGYIMKAGGKRTFRSPLLRDYWKNKFCY